jgi:hypothetical protein
MYTDKYSYGESAEVVSYVITDIAEFRQARYTKCTDKDNSEIICFTASFQEKLMQFEYIVSTDVNYDIQCTVKVNITPVNYDDMNDPLAYHLERLVAHWSFILIGRML